MAADPRQPDPLQPGPHRAAAVREMFDRIAPRYGLVNRVLTFGLDGGWRRAAVASLALPPSSAVLDVGCGPGELCLALAAGGHRAVGVDLSAGMLAAAPPGLALVQGDGTSLPVRAQAFDGVTSGFALRNVVDHPALYAELARVARPGGRLALLEVAEPGWQPALAVHRFYFRRVVPVVGGALSDRAAYRYLPDSTSFLPDPDTMAAQLQEAGWTSVRRRLLGMGAAQLVTATRA